MSYENCPEGFVPYVRSSLAQVLGYLKQWNTPIAQLGTIAGVAVKPWHLALAGAAIFSIARRIQVAINRRKSAAIAANRRADLVKQLAAVPHLDPVRLIFVDSHSRMSVRTLC